MSLRLFALLAISLAAVVAAKASSKHTVGVLLKVGDSTTEDIYKSTMANIFQQTLLPDEIVVVNERVNCNPNDEHKVAETSVIRVSEVCVNDNSGEGSLLHEAVMKSTADFLVLFEAADQFDKERIAKQIAPLVSGRADITALPLDYLVAIDRNEDGKAVTSLLEVTGRALHKAQYTTLAFRRSIYGSFEEKERGLQVQFKKTAMAELQFVMDASTGDEDIKVNVLTPGEVRWVNAGVTGSDATIRLLHAAMREGGSELLAKVTIVPDWVDLSAFANMAVADTLLGRDLNAPGSGYAYGQYGYYYVGGL